MAEVADEVVARKQPFLFARLAVYEVLADPRRVTSQARFDELLAHGHAGIFTLAVARLAASDPVAESLLHVLAYSRGNGFPRSDGIWATAGSALAGTELSDLDIARTLELAAPYIMEDTEFGQAVYRLAHRTLPSTTGRQTPMSTVSPSHEVEGLVASALIAASHDALADSRAVPAYLHDHLPEHVRAGNVWEALEGAEDLLDALDPSRVAAEAFLSTRPVFELPAAVSVTMVAVSALAHTELDRQARDLIRALGAVQLRHPLAAVTPPMLWANLRPVHPHLPLIGHTGAVTGCAFGTRQDGTLPLASTSEDLTVRLRTRAPAPRSVLADRPHEAGDRVRLRHPPRRTLLLATTSFDETVRLWDPATGAPVGDPLTGHTDAVTGCAFGTRSDGTLLLATTSYDETVRLWDPATGAPVGHPLPAHRRGVRVRVRHPPGRDPAAGHHE